MFYVLKYVGDCFKKKIKYCKIINEKQSMLNKSETVQKRKKTKCVCRTLANFGDVGVDRRSRTVTGSMPSLMRIVALYILDRGRTSREGSRPSLSLCSFIFAVFPNLPAVAPFPVTSQWNVPR